MGLTKQESDSSPPEVIVPLLARQSCHLPGNSWTEDWIQYMRNRHLLFGICLHHPLHPLETWERIMAMFGSVSFGLAATTYAHLWDHYDAEIMDEQVFAVYNDTYAVTTGMLVLWTLGGIFHSIFDIAVWNIMACACCHPGGRWGSSNMAPRCKDCGSFMLIPVVLAVMGLAALLVLTRVSVDGEENNSDGGSDNNSDGGGFFSYRWNFSDSSIKSVDGLQSFSFLFEYFVEIVLAWLIYFPAVGTLLFSGVLGCDGKLPVLGGRPRDKRLVEEELASPRRESGQSRYARMI